MQKRIKDAGVLCESSCRHDACSAAADGCCHTILVVLAFPFVSQFILIGTMKSLLFRKIQSLRTCSDSPS